MKEKKVSETKSNVISGMSSTIGAAVGVVAGSVISSEADAAEIPATPEDEQEVEVVSSQPTRNGGNATHYNPPQAPEPVPGEPVPGEPGPGEPVPGEPVPGEPVLGGSDIDPEIQVVSYETVTNEDGSQMDVAVVDVQGQTVVITDADQNGYADVMASDLNNNGQIDNDEIVDISDQHIAMQPFQEAANIDGNCNYIACDEDYINNANVDDYIA